MDTRKENGYGTALHCSVESREVSSIIELLGTGIDLHYTSILKSSTDARFVGMHSEVVLHNLPTLA